jgi:biopolymer transport protein ExbD
MMLYCTNPFGRHDGSSNLTPIIDIVFLLIIFFMLLCQFIVAENFPVNVPDSCRFAKNRRSSDSDITTVTVMTTPEQGICFAVGSEKIDASSHSDIAGRITELIDTRLKNLPPEDRIVTLRIDRDICFTEAQYALAAVAASSAVDIHLAALQDGQARTQ